MIPDGVDLNRFKRNQNIVSHSPTDLRNGNGADERLPELIEALPGTGSSSNAQVEIAGDDRICYGGPPQKGKLRVGKGKAKTRIKGSTEFVGTLSKGLSRVVAQELDARALDETFVASWSLLEAMAAGCCPLAWGTCSRVRR